MKTFFLHCFIPFFFIDMDLDKKPLFTSHRLSQKSVGKGKNESLPTCGIVFLSVVSIRLIQALLYNIRLA